MRRHPAVGIDPTYARVVYVGGGAYTNSPITRSYTETTPRDSGSPWVSGTSMSPFNQSVLVFLLLFSHSPWLHKHGSLSLVSHERVIIHIRQKFPCKEVVAHPPLAGNGDTFWSSADLFFSICSFQNWKASKIFPHFTCICQRHHNTSRSGHSNLFPGTTRHNVSATGWALLELDRVIAVDNTPYIYPCPL